MLVEGLLETPNSDRQLKVGESLHAIRHAVMDVPKQEKAMAGMARFSTVTGSAVTLNATVLVLDIAYEDSSHSVMLEYDLRDREVCQS